MNIEIHTPPPGFPPLLPGFVLQAFHCLKVQAHKVNGYCLVSKAAIVEALKRRRYGFVKVAEFIDEHPSIKEEYEVPDTAYREIE